jgi:2',3'-cyclic-nucleotide 2'-phosphodiesterase
MPKFLFIGDIVGQPGREILAERLPRLRAELGVDLVIANAENAAHGAGINAGIAKELLAKGVDAITLGDHVWDQRGWEDDIGNLPRVCRPLNLPASCPGRDHLVLELPGGVRFGVATVLGRTYINLKAECPFAAVDALLPRYGTEVDAWFIEVHAEATSEKIALGWHLDGRALAVLGTHTHVPTADATVLPRGTAHMCDVGMTGPYAGVLGRDADAVVGRFRDGLPRRFEVASEDVRLSGALVEWDLTSKRATKCELITVRRGRPGFTAQTAG